MVPGRKFCTSTSACATSSARTSRPAVLLTSIESERLPRLEEMNSAENSPPLSIAAALADGIRAVAIVFMHAYRYPEHEQRVATLARRIGFAQVSVSHEVSPLIKLVGRGDTTVVDAYLSPIIRRYVATVAEEMAAAVPLRAAPPG